MEKPLSEIYTVLQELTGFHRQLLETVRAERTHLLDVDLAAIQSVTDKKQSLVEKIRHAETHRLRLIAELAVLWQKPYKDLTLPNIVIAIQSLDPKGAEQLRSTYNALTILIQRITDQNNSNRALIENSLQHINQMKKNVLGEATSKANTYAPSGQRVNAPTPSRLISKEA